MSGPRWGLGVAVAGAGVVFGLLAQADVAIDTPTGGDHSAGYQHYISKDDCLKKVTFKFPLTVSVPSSKFEIWMTKNDTDCLVKTNRTNTPTTCVSFVVDQSARVADIAADAIVEALWPGAGATCTDPALNSDAPHEVRAYIVDPAGTNTSDGGGGFGGDTSSSSSSGVDGGTSHPAWTSVWVDLVGPDAPTGLKPAVKENTIAFTFATPSSPLPLKYSVYCAAVQGAATTCSLSGVTPGQVPSALGNCGDQTAAIQEEAAISVTKMRDGTKPTNGTTYAVAIAGLDEADNLGLLSDVVCVTPQATESFFDAYRDAGGKAGNGCGLCNAGGDTRPVLPALTGGALALAAFVARRRRRGIARRLPEAE